VSKTKSTSRQSRQSRSNHSRSKKSARRKYTPRAVSLKAAAWYAKASESFAIKAARP
jgi:hypothetical protein